jgi:hypothetical protein
MISECLGYPRSIDAHLEPASTVAKSRSCHPFRASFIAMPVQSDGYRFRRDGMAGIAHQRFFVMTKKSGASSCRCRRGGLLLCKWCGAGWRSTLTGGFGCSVAGIGHRGAEDHGPDGLDLRLVTRLEADGPDARLFEPCIPQFVLCAGVRLVVQFDDRDDLAILNLSPWAVLLSLLAVSSRADIATCGKM